MLNLESLLKNSPYLSYVYSYPHKTAYRRLPEPVSLEALWSKERKDALFLYMHIPFCEMRCGFCNLFTQARPKDEFAKSYFDTLGRQALQVKRALKEARFARMAIGGGTPTQLSLPLLASLFSLLEDTLGIDPSRIPSSVETSPETADEEKIALLAAHGVSRLSIGVQSFVEAEVSAIKRPQKNAVVQAALERIRQKNFKTLNLDLMYGLPGQTPESFLSSLRAALRFRPEELYLYPLYVRPLTGMGRGKTDFEDTRLLCYREGRDFLLSEGFSQVSMRMFRAPYAREQAGPVYCCQEDGMVGLGCGARSYTRALHYSEEYAVAQRGVREILEEYVRRPDESFTRAHYGFPLDDAEQKRRYVILSLLYQGVDLGLYRERFGAALLDDLPELLELLPKKLAVIEGEVLRLTDFGVERSDTIGHWLFSTKVRELMGEFDLR